MFEGQQVMLYNEFDRLEKFYKRLKAESQIRSMAETFANSYLIAVFACCRQLYDPSWMIGVCLSKEEVVNQGPRETFNIKKIISPGKKPSGKLEKTTEETLQERRLQEIQ